jgi:hypothetical protein
LGRPVKTAESRSYLDLIIGFIVGVVASTWTADCRGGEWDTTDKVLFGTYLAASAIDAAQTIHALDQRWPDGAPQYVEINPLYGDNPNDSVLILSKLAAAGVIFLLADHYPRYRRPILWVVTAIQVGVVASNYSIGLKLHF